MARGTSMAEWFANNPDAHYAIVDFIMARLAGDQTSVLGLLNRLKQDFEFPFSSEPSLARYLKAHGMGQRIEPIVEETEEPTQRAGRAKQIQKARTWVVTAAQNNSPVDEAFLKALLVYCEEHRAELIIRKIRYGTSKEWCASLHPYLVDDEIELHGVVIPDVRIPATTANPLTGLDSRSGVKHAVYGATKLAMKTIATPMERLPKILYSTGCVTEPNYSQTKAGNLADFHHSMSAIIIEQDVKKRTFIRSVTWDGECFIDIDTMYTQEDWFPAAPWLALVTGDEHAWFVDPKVKAATYMNSDSMVCVGRPEVVVRHDVLDCYSISHHHEGNILTQRNKSIFGWGDLRKELDDTLDYIWETTTEDFTNLIVSSNHNDHLTQWLARGERGVTPENMLLYHELMVKVLRSAERYETGVSTINPFEAYAEEYFRPEEVSIEFLSPRKGYMIHDIDVSQHGHNGPNGVRGSLTNLSKIGIKTVIGHSHSPGIMGGCWQVGTSSRYDLEYLKGPSSWLQAHCVIHANGKRQMLPIIDGKWRR